MTHWLPALAVALLLAGGGTALADAGKKGPAKEGSSFGSLKAPAPDEA